jgi:hypothetical protein
MQASVRGSYLDRFSNRARTCEGAALPPAFAKFSRKNAVEKPRKGFEKQRLLIAGQYKCGGQHSHSSVSSTEVSPVKISHVVLTNNRQVEKINFIRRLVQGYP